MAYALSTTKRKFHRILDSFPNGSTTSLAPITKHDNASITTFAEYAARKKARSEKRPMNSRTSETPQMSLVNIESERAEVSKQTTPEKKAPYFVPWDRDAFLARLKTFQHVYLWASKPDEVNEVQWAKRGWRLLDKDTVACSGCGKQVVMKLELDEPIIRENGQEDVATDEEEWRKKAQDQLVEKYAEMIVTEHGTNCLWRRRGCDATIQRMRLTQPESTLSDLRARYISFSRLKTILPTSLRTPENFDIGYNSQRLGTYLLESTTSSAVEQREPTTRVLNEDALKFALFGWEAEAADGLEVARCNACFRRLGLWLFILRPNPENPNEPREAIVDRLDLVHEHRDYCPWINPTSQSGGRAANNIMSDPPEPAGWEMLQNVIRHMKHSPDAASPKPISLSELGSPMSASTLLDRKERVAKDQERWAKLKKLKQVFRVKRPKRVGMDKDEKGKMVRPHTAT